MRRNRTLTWITPSNEEANMNGNSRRIVWLMALGLAACMMPPARGISSTLEH